MSQNTYRERAAEFNEKMGLSDPDDYWEDALVRFSVIGEEAGELLEAVNKDRNIGEELADVVITVYTGADTLDIALPEVLEASDFDYDYEDKSREQAGRVFQAAADVKSAMDARDRNELHASLMNVLVQCSGMAELHEVDLEREFNEKMDYNMQKSGVKVNGKPVDDVNENDG